MKHRMRRRRDFTLAVREGRRSSRPALVVHLVRGSGPEPARIGVIVSRRVGSAVVRNRVKRRLRHLIAPSLSSLPDGSLVVIRANPPSATAGWQQLADELHACLSSALSGSVSGGRRRQRPPAAPSEAGS
jgi:ribonuclease P protein component